jgi:hypothetical protein
MPDFSVRFIYSFLPLSKIKNYNFILFLIILVNFKDKMSYNRINKFLFIEK